MKTFEQFFSTFNKEAFFNQFLYDSKNPLLFNNGFFVYFFALFILLYFIFRNKPTTRKYIFTSFSLYFFYKASGLFVVLVILSAIVDFFLSNAIFDTKEKRRKKFLLVTSIIYNLGVLFCFKYTNFFLNLSNELFQTHFHPLNILLPIGISFYTFENLSYTIDVYRGDFKPARKFSDYLLFLSFFPKLMMGPIVRAHDFVPQINKSYVISERDFAMGFYLIISGLIKKLIISDFITLNFVNYIFDNPALHTGLENLFAVYGYAMVIYCDFSGYSDVAIGIALWLGFRIPANFMSPYQSKNITEFWRRWHISLSSWLKDYLYIPLGGNKKFSSASFIFVLSFLFGAFFISTHLFRLSLGVSSLTTVALLAILVLPSIISRDSKGIAVNFNLMTTMLLGGLWHGAKWNMIIWGAIHGIGLGIHKIWILLTGKESSGMKQHKAYRIVTGVLTFHFVCFAWIFFRAEDFDTALTMIKQIFSNFDIQVFVPFFDNYKEVLLMILIAVAIHMIPDNTAEKFISRKDKPISIFYYISIFFLFLILYGYFKSAEPVMPIYLQF